MELNAKFGMQCRKILEGKRQKDQTFASSSTSRHMVFAENFSTQIFEVFETEVAHQHLKTLFGPVPQYLESKGRKVRGNFQCTTKMWWAYSVVSLQSFLQVFSFCGICHRFQTNHTNIGSNCHHHICVINSSSLRITGMEGYKILQNQEPKHIFDYQAFNFMHLLKDPVQIPVTGPYLAKICASPTEVLFPIKTFCS